MCKTERWKWIEHKILLLVDLTCKTVQLIWHLRRQMNVYFFLNNGRADFQPRLNHILLETNTHCTQRNIELHQTLHLKIKKCKCVKHIYHLGILIRELLLYPTYWVFTRLLLLNVWNGSYFQNMQRTTASGFLLHTCTIYQHMLILHICILTVGHRPS